MERQLVDVLVVDDTPAVRDGIADFLRHAGLEVDTASNGREAILLLDRRRYVVMLLDYEMPEMDGLSVSSLLRERTERPIVLMMSGYLDIASAPIDATVVQAILEKPFNIEELAAIIRGCLPRFRDVSAIRGRATTT